MQKNISSNNTQEQKAYFYLRHIRIFMILMYCLFCSATGQAQVRGISSSKTDHHCPEINYGIQSISYWQKLAQEGCAPVTTAAPDKTPIYISSKIHAPGVLTINSADVPIIDRNDITQSENSVFVDPKNPWNSLNSNNSTNWPQLYQFDVSEFTSTDLGAIWNGIVHLGGRADPTTAIDRNGRYYIGYVRQDTGQGISWSADRGSTWNDVLVAAGPGGSDLLDKNHLWVDNSTISPHEGNLYSAWMRFERSDPNHGQIEISRSTYEGEIWSAPRNISSGVNADYQNQGVNIQTGPYGEVYAVWAIYDCCESESFPGDENAIGFARSLNGGLSWLTATRIIDDIRGIRLRELGGNKTMSVNSFPSMTVDPDGHIYVAWTNLGVPGINIGDPDIYFIKSTDQGLTWSTPARINQDTINNGRDQWFPWIASDPITGTLVCIFYDSRNYANNDMSETFVAKSEDGGETWEDFRVSDYAWSADAIQGFGGNYAGDYIGIGILANKVYPVWSDDRGGNILAYTSPFEIIRKDLDLKNLIVGSGQNFFLKSIETISAGPSFVIEEGATVTFLTGKKITLQDGFEAKEGSIFRTYISP